MCDIDKEAKEKAEKEAKQRAAREAAEKIEREKQEKEAKERAEKEALRMSRENAAIKIQNLGRNYLAKQRVKLLKKEQAVERKVKEAKALITIQGAVRVLLAKIELKRRKNKKMAALREKQEKEEAKKELEKLKALQEKEVAATKIQSLTRGKAGRELAEKRKKEQMKDALKHKSATKIQATYKGFSQRKKYKAMKPAKAASNDKGAAGAKTSDAVAQDEWIQYYDYSSQQYYYFNPRTQEASWTLPAGATSAGDGYATSGSVADYYSDGGYGYSDGYGTAGSYYSNYKYCTVCEKEWPDWATKTCRQCKTDYCDACYNKNHFQADTKNHQWDPVNYAATEDPAAATTYEAQYCIDCNVNTATKKCEQCEDPFCDSCYDIAHKKGKKAQHKWTPLGQTGPICIECEEQSAERECDQCGDKYCAKCYTHLHRKGKKATHTWRPVGANAYGAGAADAYWNDAASNASSVSDEWIQYFDEASKRPYYYNVNTQETR